MPDIDCIRGFAEASPMPIALLLGAAQRIHYVNPALAMLAGVPGEALLGCPAAEAFPDLAGETLAALDQVRATGTAQRSETMVLPLGPGAAGRLFDAEASALRGADGTTAGVLIMLRDVTAQHAALAEARAAQATLDALFRHIPEGLILVDAPDARLARVSDHGLRQVGRDAAEVLDQDAALHPATWQIYRNDGVTPAGAEELPLTRAVRQGETVEHETWVLRRHDGSTMPILCSAGPIRATDGAVTGGILCWRDVTDLQLAEAALATQEARYRALVEAGSLAVWVTTPDGQLLQKASWCALTGQTDAESDGLGWLAAVHPENQEVVRTAWLAALAGGATFEVEYRVRCPDGGWRWTGAHAVPVRDAAGRITEWIGANTDIEGRKQAEQALRASEDRFRTLAEAMPHLVWQTDATGQPEYLNRRWRALTGLGLSAASGSGWMQALHPDDLARLHADWLAAMGTGGEYDADARIRTAQGDDRWHRIRAAPVRDARGRIRHWVGTCTDVEERHRAEARLHEALAAQAGLVREADHRIKNSLQLVAALLRLQAGRLPDAVAREALEAATARVQAVAEAHRALSLSPDLRSIRLSDMLRELAAGASVQHPGADLRIAAPDELSLDAERAIPLALILSELVANALRHDRLASVEHPVRLEAAAEADGRLRVSVVDGGSGLPDNTSAGSLGETVIRALAKQIGAELAVERAPDAGTRVTLRLRLEAAG